jgi:hypothetical protein
MSRLLKYAAVLALAVAIGAYIVLGPLSLDDIFPTTHAERKAVVALLEPAPLATPASIDEELDYMVAKRLASLEGWRTFLAAHPNGAYAQSAQAEVRKRGGANDASAEAPVAARAETPINDDGGHGIAQQLGSLASYAQSATAKVEQLLLADKAPAPGKAEAPDSASSRASVASEPTEPVSSPSGDAAPVADATPVSNEAPADAKATNDTTRPAPVAGTDAAAGTEQLAALAPDEMCQRDEERLAQLGDNSSSDEVSRFASELGCERLRPRVLALIESLAHKAAADVPNTASSAAQAGNEAAPPAPPLAGEDVASLTSDETCRRDEDRIARLRSNPSSEEAQQFASELGCEALRPQLERLMESLGADAAVPPAVVNSSPLSDSMPAQVCGSERAALDRLRKEPSAEAAGLLWGDLKCEELRPQVRRLMESFNLAPDSVGAAAARDDAGAQEGATSDVRTANRTDPVACRRETAELNRIRATPDLVDAERFASAETCEALKPQTARLLDSLSK